MQNTIMPFASFFSYFPTLSTTELKGIIITNNYYYKYIVPGNYVFLEMFCLNINCDCRRALINVYSVADDEILTVLNYGWETAEYYKKWLGSTNLMSGTGPGVIIAEAKEPLAVEFLELFEHLIKHDRAYTERIVEHYYLFKKKVRKDFVKQTAYIHPQSLEYH